MEITVSRFLKKSKRDGVDPLSIMTNILYMCFYFSSALQNETCYTSDDCYDSASDCLSSRCQCAAGYEYNEVLLHCTGEALSEST